ncbi:MAG: hypothetical protein H6695_13005 [Deferribacteres bacterium]|nr:hypothetical protein [candidate division KSB1 bacterium]MCB9511103.1 hypothetical protein [Deferribacteres bacterium]
MLKTYILAILAIPALMFVWLGVQIGWRKLFHEYVEDDDVLAGRKGCADCNCLGTCQNKTNQINRSTITGGQTNGKFARL